MDTPTSSPYCQSSKLIYLHLSQFTCGALVLALDAYTWSRVVEYWGALYFAVIGVQENLIYSS